MTPDRGMAETFVSWLTGSADTPITWQLVMDRKGGPRFAQVYHLPLRRAWRTLCFENGRGVGIFAMVNEGDGLDRKAENIISLRALFVDDDAGMLDPGSVRLAALPPSFSVRSKRGYHHYWLLAPDEALDDFPDAQSSLAAHFGTDAAVKDLPRVMRVPGFFHMKDPANPVLVRLVAGTGARHSIAEILDAYPAPAGADVRCGTPARRSGGAPHRRLQGAHLGASDASRVLEAVRNLRLVRWALECPSEVSREAWRGIATNIAAAVLDTEFLHASGAALFHEISCGDVARYNRAECDRIFQDALRSARKCGPMTYRALREAGAPENACAAEQFGKAPVVVARRLVAIGV